LLDYVIIKGRQTTVKLAEQIDKDLVSAMKRQEELRLSALRMLKSALKLKQTETGKDLGEEQARAVVSMLVKQRREAAELFVQGGRRELAEKELEEAKILESYLPAAASNADLEAAVAAAISETGAATPKDLGKVMKAAMARLAGKTVDGKRLSDLAKMRLGA